jgi:hypothetical protein
MSGDKLGPEGDPVEGDRETIDRELKRTEDGKARPEDGGKPAGQGSPGKSRPDERT